MSNGTGRIVADVLELLAPTFMGWPAPTGAALEPEVHNVLVRAVAWSRAAVSSVAFRSRAGAPIPVVAVEDLHLPIEISLSNELRFRLLGFPAIGCGMVMLFVVGFAAEVGSLLGSIAANVSSFLGLGVSVYLGYRFLRYLDQHVRNVHATLTESALVVCNKQFRTRAAISVPWSEIQNITLGERPLGIIDGPLLHVQPRQGVSWRPFYILASSEAPRKVTAQVVPALHSLAATHGFTVSGRIGTARSFFSTSAEMKAAGRSRW